MTRKAGKRNVFTKKNRLSQKEGVSKSTSSAQGEGEVPGDVGPAEGKKNSSGKKRKSRQGTKGF